MVKAVPSKLHSLQQSRPQHASTRDVAPHGPWIPNGLDLGHACEIEYTDSYELKAAARKACPALTGRVTWWPAEETCPPVIG